LFFFLGREPKRGAQIGGGAKRQEKVQ